MANIKTLKPFKKGYDPKRHIKQKGETNFMTDFRIAAKEVAEALKLGKEPDKVKIELLKRGIKEGLAGNFPFLKDYFDRIYGKAKESIDMNVDIKARKLKSIQDELMQALKKDE